MEPSTTVVTLDRSGSHFMLHGEIVSYGPRTIPDEVECFRKSTTRQKLVKEVIEGALRYNINDACQLV